MMNVKDRAELIRLQAEELTNDVCARELAKANCKYLPPSYGTDVGQAQTREAIRRKIIHLRESLLVLMQEVV